LKIKICKKPSQEKLDDTNIFNPNIFNSNIFNTIFKIQLKHIFFYFGIIISNTEKFEIFLTQFLKVFNTKLF